MTPAGFLSRVADRIWDLLVKGVIWLAARGDKR